MDSARGRSGSGLKPGPGTLPVGWVLLFYIDRYVQLDYLSKFRQYLQVLNREKYSTVPASQIDEK